MIPNEIIEKVRLIEIKTRHIVSNLFGGIESNVPIHSLSLAFIAVLSAMAWMCWNNSRGIIPNTKAINSSNTVSLVNNIEEDQDILEAKS